MRGETKEGVILDETKEGILVSGTAKDGTEYNITGWTIKEPKTLIADESATITVCAFDLEESTTIECSSSVAVGIYAEYDGDTTKDVVLDENNYDIIVYVKTKKGVDVEVDDWTVQSPQTLEAGKTSIVTIDYEGLTTNLEVECSSSSLKK